MGVGMRGRRRGSGWGWVALPCREVRWFVSHPSADGLPIYPPMMVAEDGVQVRDKTDSAFCVLAECEMHACMHYRRARDSCYVIAVSRMGRAIYTVIHTIYTVPCTVFRNALPDSKYRLSTLLYNSPQLSNSAYTYIRVFSRYPSALHRHSRSIPYLIT